MINTFVTCHHHTSPDAHEIWGQLQYDDKEFIQLDYGAPEWLNRPRVREWRDMMQICYGMRSCAVVIAISVHYGNYGSPFPLIFGLSPSRSQSSGNGEKKRGIYFRGDEPISL
jgi:hypothetical protein